MALGQFAHFVYDVQVFLEVFAPEARTVAAVVVRREVVERAGLLWLVWGAAAGMRRTDAERAWADEAKRRQAGLGHFRPR